MAMPKVARPTAVQGLIALGRALDNPDCKEAADFFTPEERSAIRHHASLAAQGGGPVPLVVLARVAGSGRLDPSAVERSYQETRLMGRGAARLLLEMALTKATLGEDCPFDGEMLKFLLKGFGVATDAKPINDAERKEQAETAQRIRDLSDDDLAKEIQVMIRNTHTKEGEAS